MKTPRYSVAALKPMPGCSISRARAINDNGLVIGYSRHGDADWEAACLWKGGMPQDLGRITVNKINNKGQVAGCRLAGSSDHLHAVLCGNDRTKNLFQNNSAASDAKGINDAGQVVGYAVTPAAKWKTPADIKRGAFLWERGKRRYLETPPGYRAVQATAISSQGLVGKVWLQDANDEHAVVWRNGLVELLGEPAGLHNTRAEAVNDSGQVLVWAKSSASLPADAQRFVQQSYLWHEGRWQAINGTGLAHSLNDQGQLVGWIGTDPDTAPGPNERGETHAALWEAGTVIDLNDSIDKGSGWVLARAVDINNMGQIVGDGTYKDEARAFLLTPTI